MKGHSSRVNPFVNRQPLETGGRVPFMERARRALGHAPGSSPAPVKAPPERDESLIRQWGAADAGRVERWIERAKSNGMVVQRVAGDPVAVKHAVDSCFAGRAIGKCIVNAGELGGRLGIVPYLQSKNINVLEWGSPGCGEVAFTCDASITDCRAGLADAGSILVWSDKSFGRSSTLVVPVHVTLLPVSRILPDLIDGVEIVLRENGGNLPSNVVVINGPSKSGDIEMHMIVGVHGPKFVHVIVIDDL